MAVQTMIVNRIVKGGSGSGGGGDGLNGWSPILAAISDGERRVLQLKDWVNGTGTKPSIGYIGSSGIVSNIADAVNIRGGDGSGGSFVLADIISGETGNVIEISTQDQKLIVNLDFVKNHIADTSIHLSTGQVSAINLLNGATDNIQSQINNLAGVFNNVHVVNTVADRDGLAAQEKDICIIRGDSTHTNQTTMYLYTDSDWVFLVVLSVTVRNFLIAPIDLTSEVTGVLPQANVDLTDVAKLDDLPEFNGDTDQVLNGLGLPVDVKTINGESLMGNGDIEISGGGTSTGEAVWGGIEGDILDQEEFSILSKPSAVPVAHSNGILDPSWGVVTPPPINGKFQGMLDGVWTEFPEVAFDPVRVPFTLTFKDVNGAEVGALSISIQAEGSGIQIAQTDANSIFENLLKTSTTYAFEVLDKGASYFRTGLILTTGTLDIPLSVVIELIENNISDLEHYEKIKEVVELNADELSVAAPTTFGDFSGSNKWFGGVLAPNGKIYGIPYSTTSILEIDPETRTATTFGSLGGSNKWSGGVLAPNGKIYGIPASAASILEIDPVTRTATTFGDFSGTWKWQGGVLAPNGKIYGTPHNSGSILEIDPETQTATTFGSFSEISRWTGGVLAPNGKIYGIPASATSILEIDPETRTATTFGSFSGTYKWSGGVLAPNGKIYGVPQNNADVLEISFSGDELTNFSASTLLSGFLNKF